MSEVNRLEMDHKGLPFVDENGVYVLYEDYANLKEQFDFKQNLTEQVVTLQKQRDALAVEVSAIREQAEDVYAAGYRHGHVNTVDGIAYATPVQDEFYHNALQVMLEVETPATDAYINSVRADTLTRIINTGEFSNWVNQGLQVWVNRFNANSDVHLCAGKDGE